MGDKSDLGEDTPEKTLELALKNLPEVIEGRDDTRLDWTSLMVDVRGSFRGNF